MRLLVKIEIDVSEDYYTSGDSSAFIANVVAAVDDLKFNVMTHAGYSYGKMYLCSQGDTREVLWKPARCLSEVLSAMILVVHTSGFTASKLDARLWEGPGISCYDI